MDERTGLNFTGRILFLQSLTDWRSVATQTKQTSSSFIYDQDMIELLNIKNGMDEINKSNRHEVQIPSHIRAAHPALKFLHFFQKWLKPILAEFVATFILIFWACMLQPPVRET